MTKTGITQPVKLPLADFLARLDDVSAAEARVAAARIDELSRIGNSMEGVERQFLWPAAVAALAFLAGLWFLLVPGTVSPFVTVICLGALPATVVIYGLRVMSRTQADRAAEDLNRRHFLPHGGIYFAEGLNPACVVRVEAQNAGDRETPGITRKDIWW